MESFEQIDIENNRIKELLEKMKLKQLNLQEYSELQMLLLRREASFSNSYPLSRIAVLGDKIMFLADTHSGNGRAEKLEFLDIAYNNALKQNIKAVIHAGDLTEACPVEHDKKFEIVLQELLKAYAHMPNEIITGLVLGNHDYSAIRTHPSVIPYYFNTSKIFVLGMQQVLLNWGDINILVSHPVSQLTMAEDGHTLADIIIEGHHHKFDFHEDERKIDLPSASRDALGFLVSSLYDKYRQKYSRLFLTASKQDENIVLFEIYSIECNRFEDIIPTDTIELNTKTKQLRLYK